MYSPSLQLPPARAAGGGGFIVHIKGSCSKATILHDTVCAGQRALTSLLAMKLLCG